MSPSPTPLPFDRAVTTDLGVAAVALFVIAIILALVTIFLIAHWSTR